MRDSIQKPILQVFAGPNGSGKSTVARGIQTVGIYTNADDIQKRNNLTDMEAAKEVEKLRHESLDRKENFSFETVLSTDRSLNILKKAKKLGYEVQCIYVLTCDVNINVARVKARFANGGHDVLEEKIRSRYPKALKLLPKVFEICDKIVVYDNTIEPFVIVSKHFVDVAIFPNSFWTSVAIEKLILHQNNIYLHTP